MARAAVQEQLTIAQEREPEAGLLTIPSPLIEKFKAIKDEAGRIRPQFIAGVILDAPRLGSQSVIEQARRLEQASRDFRSSNTSLIYAGNRGLHVGRTGTLGADMTVFNRTSPLHGDSWYEPSEVHDGAGLEMRVRHGVSANFEGGGRRFSVRAFIRDRQPLYLPLPHTVVTDNTVGYVDLECLAHKSTLTNGVMAVGEQAVTQFFSVLREQGLNLKTDKHDPIPQQQLDTVVEMAGVVLNFPT